MVAPRTHSTSTGSWRWRGLRGYTGRARYSLRIQRQQTAAATHLPDVTVTVTDCYLILPLVLLLF